MRQAGHDLLRVPDARQEHRARSAAGVPPARRTASTAVRPEPVLRGVPRRASGRPIPRSDLGRIERQQAFLQQTANATIDRLQADPFLASNLITAGTNAVRMDPGLDPIAAAGTLRKAFSSGLNKYQLPVVGVTKDGNAVLVLDAGAEPILDYFRGVGPAPVGRAVVDDVARRPMLSAVMKALILAGGAGTRLRPITHTRAKQLVPVANTPILHYGIRSMVAAGITELGVIVGDTRDEVMADLGDGSQFGAQITFIPQDEPLGPRALRPDRPRVPRRRRLRHVPRRQPARTGPRGVRRRVRRSAGGRSAAVGTDSAEGGVRPPSLRHRLARQRGSRRPPRREARRPAVEPRPRRRVPVRRRDPRGRGLDRAVGTWRTGDHRRHPVADRPGARRAHARS